MGTESTTNVQQEEIKRLCHQIAWLRTDLDKEILEGLAEVSAALRAHSWSRVLHETKVLDSRLVDLIFSAEGMTRQSDDVESCLEELGAVLPQNYHGLEQSEQRYLSLGDGQASLALEAVNLFLRRLEWFYVHYPKGDNKRPVYMSLLQRYSKQSKVLAAVLATSVIVPIGQNLAASVIYDSARREAVTSPPPTEWTVLPATDSIQRVQSDYRTTKDRFSEPKLTQANLADLRRSLLEIAGRADRLGKTELADDYRVYTYLQYSDRLLKLNRNMREVEDSFVSAAEITRRICADGGKKRDAVPFCKEVVPALRKVSADVRCSPAARRTIRGYLSQVTIL